MAIELLEVPLLIWALFLSSIALTLCAIMDRVLLIKERISFAKLAKQKYQGFPLLADAWSEYLSIRDQKVEEYLRVKKRPAYSTAEKMKECTRERREYARLAKILEYQIRTYETLFPWLTEFSDGSIDEQPIEDDGAHSETLTFDNTDDPAKRWLSPLEYKALSAKQRNQRALDRHLSRRKSKWEIGRDYERYVGYTFEQQGFEVEFFGAIQGLEDLGRDLIAKRNGEVKIIQCKHWSENKQIHEKHIFQVFGTAIEYAIRTGEISNAGSLSKVLLIGMEKVTPILITSTRLSEKAREIAEKLGVVIQENFKLSPYPVIKCNKSSKGDQRIYHLPFDQQYDRVKIEFDRGELYVDTVEGAEMLGFRRANRWKGTNTQ
jgi:hypothetical protein